MKIQTSFRNVKASCGLLVATRCDDHRFLEKMFGIPNIFAAGVFGWNADFFKLPRGIVVAAGYRPQGQWYNYHRLEEWYDVFRLCKTEDERDKVREAIAADMLGEYPLKEHHTAARRGYISRKGIGYREAYRGHYGIGVVRHSPRWDSTRYHYVTYYTL